MNEKVRCGAIAIMLGFKYERTKKGITYSQFAFQLNTKQMIELISSIEYFVSILQYHTNIDYYNLTRTHIRIMRKDGTPFEGKLPIVVRSVNTQLLYEMALFISETSHFINVGSDCYDVDTFYERYLEMKEIKKELEHQND